MTRPLDGLGWRHAMVPAAILGAAVAIVGAFAGFDAVAARLGPALLMLGLILAFTAPVAAAALVLHRGTGGAAALAVAAGAFAVSLIGLNLPRLEVFAGLDWNWQGKTFDLVWMLALIAMLSPDLRREIGWRLDIAPGTLGPALVNIAIWGGFGFLFARMGMFGDLAATDLTLERVLFDTTYPNLVEEILFRGLMLAVLDRAFRPQWTLLGARVGWGVLITAWVFGVAHGVGLDAEGAIAFDLAWLAQTFVMGLVLGWVRALTGSLWPAFLGHCAPEIGILVALATL